MFGYTPGERTKARLDEGEASGNSNATLAKILIEFMTNLAGKGGAMLGAEAGGEGGALVGEEIGEGVMNALFDGATAIIESNENADHKTLEGKHRPNNPKPVKTPSGTAKKKIVPEAETKLIAPDHGTHGGGRGGRYY